MRRLAEGVAEFWASSSNSVFAFTYRGSPIYKRLILVPTVKMLSMTTSVSYVTSTERENESLVPQFDQAILLDALSKSLASAGGVTGFFDSVSDLLVLTQTEKTYAFLKLAIELISTSKGSRFFVMKSGTTDDRTENLICGLFPFHFALTEEGIVARKVTEV